MNFELHSQNWFWRVYSGWSQEFWNSGRMATLRTSIKNFVYFLNEKDHSRSSESRISNEKLTQILKALAKHALKEKTPPVHDLERPLQGVIQEQSPERHLLR